MGSWPIFAETAGFFSKLLGSPALQGKSKIPFGAGDHEIGHGRNITWTLRAVAAGFRVAVEALGHITEAWIGTNWIVTVTASGTRDTTPFHATHMSRSTRRTSRWDTSLHTTPEAILRRVRDRWSIEGWHSIREPQLREDGHHDRGQWRGADRNRLGLRL